MTLGQLKRGLQMEMTKWRGKNGEQFRRYSLTHTRLWRKNKRRKPGDELSINWLQTVPSLSEDLKLFWVCKEDICAPASMQRSAKVKDNNKKKKSNVLLQTAMVELSQHTGYKEGKRKLRKIMRVKERDGMRGKWKELCSIKTIKYFNDSAHWQFVSRECLHQFSHSRARVKKKFEGKNWRKKEQK